MGGGALGRNRSFTRGWIRERASTVPTIVWSPLVRAKLAAVVSSGINIPLSSTQLPPHPPTSYCRLPLPTVLLKQRVWVATITIVLVSRSSGGFYSGSITALQFRIVSGLATPLLLLWDKDSGTHRFMMTFATFS